MNFSNRNRVGLFGLMVVGLIVLAITVGAVAAQDGSTAQPDYPTNTITVTGMGSAAGAPDVANLEVGAEVINTDVAVAFGEANDTIDAVIAAIVAAGVAAEDIRTTGLDVYADQPFVQPGMSGMEGQATERTYHVTNRIRVTVRDIALVEAVIDAAVNAGANNLFGLTFGFSDQAGLESDARVAALDDARQRAEQLAELVGAELGDAIVVNETSGGFYGAYDELSNRSTGMGGGASIEPGSLSVSVQVQVTYRLVR